MFFNFIKNTNGGFLKHWILKDTPAELFILLTSNLKLLFMWSVALYVVSNISALAESSANTWNNDHPLTLSAFVSAVNVIAILLMSLIQIPVSAVYGGVIIARLSSENIIVLLLLLLLPLSIGLSLPHPTKYAANATNAKNITIYATAFALFLCVTLKKFFIINKFDLPKNNNISCFSKMQYLTQVFQAL